MKCSLETVLESRCLNLRLFIGVVCSDFITVCFSFLRYTDNFAFNLARPSLWLAKMIVLPVL